LVALPIAANLFQSIIELVVALFVIALFIVVKTIFLLTGTPYGPLAASYALIGLFAISVIVVTTYIVRRILRVLDGKDKDNCLVLAALTTPEAAAYLENGVGAYTTTIQVVL
jgi:hypothetical protein